FGDDLHLNAKRRAGVDDALLLSGIHPGHRHLRVAAGYLFDHRPATDGVLDAGRGRGQEGRRRITESSTLRGD
ncbi:MAG TPA: hypothetical protein VFC00_06070, partial [Micromonosporaceae bacterium]|nr:hypothetical protein [Micromonosporaceae bacterium]